MANALLREGISVTIIVVDPWKLRRFLEEKGEPAYRSSQVLKAVYQDAVPDYAAITTLPRNLRRELREAVPLLSMRKEALQASQDAKAYKAVLRLRDGLLIETVLMSPKPGHWTACISAQVGCAMRCSFCATGLMGLSRNLTAEEIADQVLFWRMEIRARRLPLRLSNVVYMGMGEPFHNLRAVEDSIRMLTDPELFGIGDRHIAVSTAGIAPAIEEFGRKFPRVRLALSLHAADDELRSRLVPLNRAYPLSALRRALKGYFEASSQKVFIEYVLLQGENDQPRHAGLLARWLKSLGHKERLHVNLIVFNPTDTPHAPTTREAARVFRDILRGQGVRVTIRKTLGQDIEGACGQLIVRQRD